jgi:hypothetical protein
MASDKQETLRARNKVAAFTHCINPNQSKVSKSTNSEKKVKKSKSKRTPKPKTAPKDKKASKPKRIAKPKPKKNPKEATKTKKKAMPKKATKTIKAKDIETGIILLIMDIRKLLLCILLKSFDQKDLPLCR